MKKQNSDHYFNENGLSVFNIYYKDKKFTGQAQCAKEDEDMKSERTGLTIAEAKAAIKLLIFIRDYEIKPQLNILNHLYGNMTTSKYFNSNSYEARMIRSQIRAIEKELATINNDLADERKFLKDYIEGKEKMYQKLRAKNK